MLPNRLIITKKSKREEIYKKSEKKWIIDFEQMRVTNEEK